MRLFVDRDSKNDQKGGKIGPTYLIIRQESVVSEHDHQECRMSCGEWSEASHLNNFDLISQVIVTSIIYTPNHLISSSGYFIACTFKRITVKRELSLRAKRKHK